jgi:hypothetical protein
MTRPNDEIRMAFLEGTLDADGHTALLDRLDADPDLAACFGKPRSDWRPRARLPSPALRLVSVDSPHRRRLRHHCGDGRLGAVGLLLSPCAPDCAGRA